MFNNIHSQLNRLELISDLKFYKQLTWLLAIAFVIVLSLSDNSDVEQTIDSLQDEVIELEYLLSNCGQ